MEGNVIGEQASNGHYMNIRDEECPSGHRLSQPGRGRCPGPARRDHVVVGAVNASMKGRAFIIEQLFSGTGSSRPSMKDQGPR